MSEDKKPKIDLKARLGKAHISGMSNTAPIYPPGLPLGAVPPPAGVPVAPSILPAPVMSPIGNPAAPSSSIDEELEGFGASSPFAARKVVKQVVPAAAQRIEIDETAIKQASGAAFKKAMGVAFVLALLFGGVGFMAGGASEKGRMAGKASGDAQLYKGNVDKAKVHLEDLAKKLEAGRDALKANKFPEGLAGELNAINIDFDGSQLVGRRYNGKAMPEIISFITSVQAISDKKSVISRLLNKAQKPLVEQFQNGSKGRISHIVAFLGGSNGDVSGVLAPLSQPILIENPATFTMPEKFTFVSEGKNVEAPRYKKTGKVDGAAVPVLTKSINSNFPAESTQLSLQLLAQMVGTISEIKGDSSENMENGKAGLIDRATRLSKLLDAR